MSGTGPGGLLIEPSACLGNDCVNDHIAIGIHAHHMIEENHCSTVCVCVCVGGGGGGGGGVLM